MIDGRYIFGQPVKNDIRTYENNNKFATGERDNNKTDCLLDYSYFPKNIT